MSNKQTEAYEENKREAKEEFPTPKDWAKWYAHKSGKELWIEEQEKLEEE